MSIPVELRFKQHMTKEEFQEFSKALESRGFNTRGLDHPLFSAGHLWSILGIALTWSRTPQGKEYWRAIYRRFEEQGL